MDFLNREFIVALGGIVVAIILASKLDGEAAKQVSIHVIDACKECNVTKTGD